MQYIRHLVGMRNDPRIVRLVATEGQAYKGVYWDLLEILCERGGRLKFADCPNIAYELHIRQDVLERIIKDYGLFQYNDKVFWDKRILIDLESNKRRSQSMKKRWQKKQKKEAPKAEKKRRVSKPYRIMQRMIDLWNEKVDDNPINREQIQANQGRWMRHIKSLLRIYKSEDLLYEKFSEILENYEKLWQGAQNFSYIITPGHFVDILNGRFLAIENTKGDYKDVKEERLDYPFLA